MTGAEMGRLANMGDLQVATDELRALADRLGTLGNELADGDAKKSYSTTELAHRTVIDGMDEFNDNWDDNRKRLAEKLTKLGELARETADGFEQADEELAREVAEAVDLDGENG